ncbi:MAG: helix-turn-helix transcriptional regulator [Eggerthellaceae bacterium]|nr:helix-turn-helix transcriptional regulator [Eggerthellaceae bacterium]
MLENASLEPQEAKAAHGAGGEEMTALFLGGIGFACYMTVLLIFSGGPAFPLFAHLSVPDAFLCRIASVAVCVAVLAASYFKASSIMDEYKRRLVPATLCMLPAFAVCLWSQFAGPLPLWVHLAAWMVFGVGFGCLTLLQIILFSNTGSRRSMLSVAGGTLPATLLFVAVGLQLNDLVFLGEAFVVTVLAIASAWFASMRQPRRRVVHYADETRKIPLSSLPNELFMVAQGIAFGFVTVVLCGMGPVMTVAGFSLGTIGDLIALFWVVRFPKSEVTQGVVQRVSMVPMIAGIALLPFGGDVWKVLCSALVMVSISHSQMMFWVFSIVDNLENQLHPVRRFAYRQIADWIGFIIGMGIGVAVYEASAFQAHNNFFAMAVAGLVMVIVMAFAAYGADDELARRYLSDLIESVSVNEIREIVPAAHFRERCEQVADRHMLTNREKEVFVLLAKGRNNKHIQGELYIGPSTTKSHIYNIYKKLGVSSQQALIDMVDELKNPPNRAG